ncbi:winged helix-turn-helix transcriptional regulator [Streptomyces sp. NPDC046860]|uniref:winged helix-turn-helix transcriptional regulator n=1 Tax=Streptomyces sp. NPDC046860 TaxID=3154495 RepID=UPI0033DB40A4
MAIAAALPPHTAADIARVTETLAMITPRWNVRILLALNDRPQRYMELWEKLPWLQPAQLHPKLTSLCDAGLVQRTKHSPRHVTYAHTERAKELLPVLPLIVAWAEEHLEQADSPLTAIEQIEDSLTLLNRRHAAAILWVLKERGVVDGGTLGRMIMPKDRSSNVYPPLRQLVADGLVDSEGAGHPFRLSAAGASLAPVFGALSTWAAGQPLAQAARHPLWGNPRTAPAAKPWVSNQPRAPRTALPQSGDLFSHPPTARPKAALPAGGPHR